MGCGSSTQVGSAENQPSSDQKENEDSQAEGQQVLNGETVEDLEVGEEGSKNRPTLDKAPLPPIKGKENDSQEEEEEAKDADPMPRPKTSNLSRSPRRLPKLSDNIGPLPEVEDDNEDSSDEVDTAERGVGTTPIDTVSILSLGKGGLTATDDDHDVVSMSASKLSVRSNMPTPVPPSSQSGSHLSLNVEQADGHNEDGEDQDSRSATRASHVNEDAVDSPPMSRKSSRASLSRSTSRKNSTAISAASSRKQSTHSQQDTSTEAGEVGAGSRGSSRPASVKSSPEVDPGATSEAEPPQNDEDEAGNDQDPADNDSGTEVEGTPTEKEDEADSKAASEEPEDEGIHEDNEPKPADPDDQIQTEIENETPIIIAGGTDPSRASSAVPVA
eukprot:maker-scaffold730_size105374-snap-gene-0.22 protein:Tk06148 transcript:maker-scaffold730_size105374-snap-gene-0.22-mRNA-1 annotation:"---NA---"